ncbi:MAG TPA: hypothetical protein VJJ78_00810 [Candidatus Saccharimonadales bacterium]|nr:hypothetical protein [Candidatus Saccharimonadales bacterium]
MSDNAGRIDLGEMTRLGSLVYGKAFEEPGGEGVFISLDDAGLVGFEALLKVMSQGVLKHAQMLIEDGRGPAINIASRSKEVREALAAGLVEATDREFESLGRIAGIKYEPIGPFSKIIEEATKDKEKRKAKEKENATESQISWPKLTST